MPVLFKDISRVSILCQLSSICSYILKHTCLFSIRGLLVKPCRDHFQEVSISELWTAVNTIMHEELMTLCAKFMGSHLDRVNCDPSTWKFIQPSGIQVFLKAVDFNEKVSEILDYWIRLDETTLDPEDKLCNLIDLLDFGGLPFDLILFLYTTSIELGLPKDHKYVFLHYK